MKDRIGFWLVKVGTRMQGSARRQVFRPGEFGDLVDAEPKDTAEQILKVIRTESAAVANLTEPAIRRILLGGKP